MVRLVASKLSTVGLIAASASATVNGGSSDDDVVCAVDQGDTVLECGA